MSVGKGRRIEPVLVTWGRRALTIPGYFVLALACGLAAPIWGALAILVDVVLGDARRLPRARALSFFVLYLVCEVAGVVASAVLWLTSLGGLVSGPVRFVEQNAALQRWWTGMLFKGALVVFSMRVEAEGVELAREGPFLLFVRHTSTADTVLAAALVANPNRLLLRYVLKRELLWDPCLDIVGRRLPNAFVDRKAPRLQGEVLAVAALAHELGAHDAVLIYPEGTRFHPDKLPRAVLELRTKGMAELADIAAGYRTVLPPRIAGPLALLDAAPGVDVVVLEHRGFEGAATFRRFWNGELIGRTIHARVRRIPAASIPKDDRARWLFETWAETDAWVQSGDTR